MPAHVSCPQSRRLALPQPTIIGVLESVFRSHFIFSLVSFPAVERELERELELETAKFHIWNAVFTFLRATCQNWTWNWNSPMSMADSSVNIFGGVSRFSSHRAGSWHDRKRWERTFTGQVYTRLSARQLGADGAACRPYPLRQTDTLPRAAMPWDVKTAVGFEKPGWLRWNGREGRWNQLWIIRSARYTGGLVAGATSATSKEIRRDKR